ncbi:MAG TPA: YCF48-related protein, partial [Terriglobales bacterium]|nr:YCF48-related protein [Terriglobales bacterium]
MRSLRAVFVNAAGVAVIIWLMAGLAAAQYSESLYSGMKWRVVGPFRGGRVLAVAGIPGDPSTYYFGAVAGGVWKSTDGGNNWVPMFDKEGIASVGAIAVAESNPNVIYVGSGEACIRGNISYGDGVYKSIDGGKSWANVGLKDSEHIGALVIDPKNADVAFVAALGHAYGPNVERGVFRTRDGGKTWEKVLYRDDHTGAIDVVFDPNNPNILYASLWQVQRTPWSLNSGGEGSGLYKSSDGGSTWKRLEGNGLPKGILGRIGVTVSGADSNKIYALIEAKEGGIYRSDDGGDHWRKVNEDERYRQRAWYFTHIFADPKSADTVYVLNTG